MVPRRRLNLWVTLPFLKGLVCFAFLRDTPGDTWRWLLGCFRPVLRTPRKAPRFVAPSPTNGTVMRPPQVQRCGHHHHSLMDQPIGGPPFRSSLLRSHRHTFAAMVLAPCGSSTTQRRFCHSPAPAPPRIGVVVIYGIALIWLLIVLRVFTNAPLNQYGHLDLTRDGCRAR